MLTYAEQALLQSQLGTLRAGTLCARMLTDAHVCSRMLTYALGAGGDSLQDREFVGGGLAVLKSLGYSGSSEDEGRSLCKLHKLHKLQPV